jgi:predicted TIM-barrel enzyme
VSASPTTAPTVFRLEPRPFVCGALHLLPFGFGRSPGRAEVEDYVLANAAAFADGGVPALMIQDQTREPGAASVETVARMAALVRLVKAAHPSLVLGVIVQAHDAVAPIAIAAAAGADFVRLKVFVGEAMTSEGPKSALGVTAAQYRDALGRPDIGLFADVQDRTSLPLGGVPADRAAVWTEALGADALVITGDSFPDTLARIAAARKAGAKGPVLIGGGIDEDNVGEALRHADGMIVSRSLMRPASEPGPLRWDAAKARRLMNRIRAAQS